ncbi:Protein piwi, partial [Orchesella cincta]
MWYVTSIRHHEDKMLLCVETTHKVLRMDSVLLVIKGLERSFGANQNAFREAVKKELNGTIVMTTYNRKTYHIDDIEFDKSPQSMFERKGEQQTLVDYYRSLTIKDLKQPLLKAKSKQEGLACWEKAADPGDILLVPELCQSTGLTDNMRANFSLMKELSKYLHQAPQEKGPRLDGFNKRMREHPEVRFTRIQVNHHIKSELVNWGMELDGKLVELKGRILAKEVVSFAKGTHQVDDKGDFTMAFRSQQMLTSVNLTTWVIIVPQRDFAGVDNLVRTMTKVAAPLSMAIGNPKQIIKVPDARSGSYLSAMEDALNLKPQMIFVILPNNKAELYNVVKKRLAVDKGVPSQCFLAKNVTSKGLMSIHQGRRSDECQAGRRALDSEASLKSCMFVGFDVYHGAKGSKGGSVGAMVATFSANFTKYFSTTSLFKTNDELCETMLADLIMLCIYACFILNSAATISKRSTASFRSESSCIVTVGEGQLKAVYNIELTKLSEGLMKMYANGGRSPPLLTFIVVSKRVNTRLMMMKMNLQNPPPGTIVDEVVTLPERYDFLLDFLCCRQGTVSPCSYNVLQDENNFDADRIQL